MPRGDQLSCPTGVFCPQTDNCEIIVSLGCPLIDSQPGTRASGVTFPVSAAFCQNYFASGGCGGVPGPVPQWQDDTGNCITTQAPLNVRAECEPVSANRFCCVCRSNGTVSGSYARLDANEGDCAAYWADNGVQGPVWFVFGDGNATVACQQQQPRGACCDGGFCTPNQTACACASRPGTTWHEGMDCSDRPGSCCDPTTGQCFNTNSVCGCIPPAVYDSHECNEFGSCCRPAGCAQTGGAMNRCRCTFEGGVWTYGVGCGEVAACCDRNNNTSSPCVNQDKCSCQQQQGRWIQGKVCADAPCHTACCGCENTWCCAGKTESQCLADGGLFWAQRSCVGIPCPNALPTCRGARFVVTRQTSVGNVFRFITPTRVDFTPGCSYRMASVAATITSLGFRAPLVTGVTCGQRNPSRVDTKEYYLLRARRQIGNLFQLQADYRAPCPPRPAQCQ